LPFAWFWKRSEGATQPVAKLPELAALPSALASALRLSPEGRLGPDSCYVSCYVASPRFKAGLRRDYAE